MVGVHARVDDVADRQRREPADRGEHLVGHRGGAGVDEDDALGPDLHDDVAARAADDVEILPQLDDFDTPLAGAVGRTPFARTPVARTRCRSTRRARGAWLIERSSSSERALLNDHLSG